jgi:pyruvate carboxylase
MVVLTRALVLLLATTSAGALVSPKPSFSVGRSLLQVATSEDVSTDVDATNEDCITPFHPSCEVPLFNNVLAANRAEIAVRIMRAATEMNSGTVAIYDHEDRYSQHRWGADRSYKLEKAPGATPISAYLDIPQIIKIAKEAKVDAIHPGCVNTNVKMEMKN